jgi:XPB/Ssl2-like helicase family protein/WYL domain-containing protein
MGTEPTTARARGPRSLADWLRGVADDDLAALLTARPDLAVPVPPDLAVLSARATTRPSTGAAIDRLDRWSLEVLDTIAAQPDPTSLDVVIAALAGASADDVRRGVDRLRALALAWGEDGALHVTRTVRELLPEAVVPTATHPTAPDVVGIPGDATTAEHAGVAEALTACRTVEQLLEAWVVQPPAAVRAGGISARELKRTAASIERSEVDTALFVETAYAAGLLGTSEEVWLPTSTYDAWRTAPDPERWLALVAAWLTMSRTPGLVTRADRDRTLGVLSPDLDRMLTPQVRLATLHELDALPLGHRADADSIRAVLRWRTPRRGGALRDDLVGWTLDEAAALGVTGAGALTSASRLLLHDDRPGAARVLAALVPEPVDHVLVQADLTAVAPGPLERSLGRQLALVADVESTGHATVYRFTEQSIRRALDTGTSAADIHALLARHSRTPVPQPLTYLIDDVARRHGRVRVSSASSFIRSDDTAALAEILAAKKAATLRLRALAPTVLAADATPERVLEVLRAIGHAPVAESATGDVVLAGSRRRRADRAHPPTPVVEPTGPAGDLLVAAVRMLRAGDRASTAPRRPVVNVEPTSAVMPQTSSANTLLALQEAAQNGTPLWIGYVNAQGQATQRVVEPLTVDGGYLRAFDHLRDEVRTFAIHRITGVAVLEDDAQ